MLKLRRPEEKGDWIEKSSLPPRPNMNAQPVNLQASITQTQNSQSVYQASSTLQYPDISNLAGNQQVVSQPTVIQQWTDANGNTWRSMSDGSTLWWNGFDWQRAG